VLQKYSYFEQILINCEVILALLNFTAIVKFKNTLAVYIRIPSYKFKKHFK
jgi:hypothetical protein